MSHSCLISPQHSSSSRLWSYLSPFFPVLWHCSITPAFVPGHLSFCFLVKKPWFWIYPLISSQFFFHLKLWLTCFHVPSTFNSCLQILSCTATFFFFLFSTVPLNTHLNSSSFLHHHCSGDLPFNESHQVTLMQKLFFLPSPTPRQYITQLLCPVLLWSLLLGFTLTALK